MEISEYFGDWTPALNLQWIQHTMQRLLPFHQQLCPTLPNVFKAFTLCPMHKVRCVILGQDPYSTFLDNHPVATGIAFANANDNPKTAFSPSLEVLRESVINFSIPHNHVIFDPSLETWERQGVLMLNTALTCLHGKTGCHTLLWRPFITALLSQLSQRLPGVVYVLMGSQAQSFEGCINCNQHVIHCRHPAWYARTHNKLPSSIWQGVNDILTSQNGYGVEWYKEVY